MFAVLNNNNDYKRDLDDNIRLFDTIDDAVLFFTVSCIGYVTCEHDKNALIHESTKNVLRIVEYEANKV